MFHKKKLFRECSNCNKLTIPENEPKWKKTCINCYLKNKPRKYECFIDIDNLQEIKN
jgi:hypothetical protein